MIQRIVKLSAALVTVLALVTLSPQRSGHRPSRRTRTGPRRAPRGAIRISRPSGTTAPSPRCNARRTWRSRRFSARRRGAEIEQQAQARVDRENAPSEVRTEPLPVGGNVGAYNSFWTEQSTSVVGTNRTSIITDPENGRLPPLTRRRSPGSRRPSPCAWPTRRTARSRRGSGGHGPERALPLVPRIPSIPTATTTTSTSSRHPTTSRSCRNTSTTCGSSISTTGPTCRTASASSPAARAAAGKATRSWSRRPTCASPHPALEPSEHALSRGKLSESATVTERITRTGPDTLDYTFTIDDPETWNRRGRAPSRMPARTCRCTSSRVTRATTGCSTC